MYVMSQFIDRHRLRQSMPLFFLLEISKDIRATIKDNQEIKRIEYGIYKILSSKLNQTICRIKEDSKYWSDKGDHFLTSNEAIAYGIVDKVFQE